MKRLETLPLAEAAKAVGKSKTTIWKRWKKEDIQGFKDGNEEVQIYIASLCQVYKMLPGYLKKHETGNVEKETVVNDKVNSHSMGHMSTLPNHVNDLIEALNARIKDFEKREEEWNKQLERRDEHLKSLTTQLNNAHSRLLTFQPQSKGKRWKLF